MTLTGGESMHGVWQLRRGDTVVAENVGGPTGADHGATCALTTLFQVSSISKQFVAACALLLEESGLLSIDDPVGRWWTRAPMGWKEMKVGHLLAHSAGLPHWPGLPGVDPTVAAPPREELLDRLAAEPLQSPPGRRWCYSSPGYVLAATIVEEAGGQPYGELVDRRLFAPLGMVSTTSGHVPDANLIAQGHRDGQVLPIVPGLSSLPGTGDVWSTLDDLARYSSARFDGALLSARSWARMTRIHARIEEEGPSSEDSLITLGYGYGLYIGSINGHEVHYVSGDNPGFRSLLAWLPRHRISYCALSNEESTLLEDAFSSALRTTGVLVSQ